MENSTVRSAQCIAAKPDPNYGPIQTLKLQFQIVLARTLENFSFPAFQFFFFRIEIECVGCKQSISVRVSKDLNQCRIDAKKPAVGSSPEKADRYSFEKPKIAVFLLMEKFPGVLLLV